MGILHFRVSENGDNATITGGIAFPITGRITVGLRDGIGISIPGRITVGLRGRVGISA